MDLGIVAAVVMLVVWAVGALVFDAPGSVNALLTFGVFVLIWRIVVRSTPAPPKRVPGESTRKAR